MTKLKKTISNTNTEIVPKWECYTFIDNVSIGLDVYWIGERVLLTKSDLVVYWPYVVLTKDYKWQIQSNKTRKDCWC